MDTNINALCCWWGNHYNYFKWNDEASNEFLVHLLYAFKREAPANIVEGLREDGLSY